MAKPTPTNSSPLTRREFVRVSAAASAATLLTGCATTGTRGAPAILHPEHKAERLRVGVIGCGGRGTGAAQDCVTANENVDIVALADLFPDRLAQCRKDLEPLGDRLKVTNENCFTGFHGYKGVLQAGVDLVILATPPHFRPQHLAAAVAAGKHVFMEKPVAVDPVGIRSVLASADEAQAKGLAIVAGTQRRHDPRYRETLKRIHDGAIGKLVGAQCYWNQGALWVHKPRPEWTDMEWQCRNWLYFTWLSGDHVVEQHVHNLDVVIWAMGAPPVKAVGMGGRQTRTEPEYGNVFDHFAIEYEFPGGVRALSMCRQVHGTSERITEYLVGTSGTAEPKHGEIAGWRKWKYREPEVPVNPYVQEHANLVHSIRRGRPLNEGRQVAESTLAAIMGRISAYTGREVSWDWTLNASQLDLSPKEYVFGPLPVEPPARPGETKLV